MLVHHMYGVEKHHQDLIALALHLTYSAKQLDVKSVDGLFLKNQLEHVSLLVKRKQEIYTSGVLQVDHTT